jgi:predicted phage terminase large subunit-like protein
VSAAEIDTDAELAALDVADVADGGFASFVKIAWCRIISDPLIWEPHLQLMCDHYEAVYRGEIKDLVVNVPPSTSKSSIASKLFPVWVWLQDPKLKFMFTTYDKGLTGEFANASKTLINSAWFQARWPHVQIVDGERANTGDYWTTAGGRRISTFMGGPAVGKHAHILVVDDPIKPDNLDANPDSLKAVLEECWTRWIDTFSTRRANPKTFRRICLMQRLHEGDLSGRMLKMPGVTHLMLPSEFDPDRACVTPWGRDWRTKRGELLSVRFPQEVIEQFRREMSPRKFAAQHDQNPRPAEGILFQKQYFDARWVAPPAGGHYTMSVDANLKERKDSDFCCVQVWCQKGPDFYLVDQCMGRWGYSVAVENIKSMRNRWSQVREILIEDKANGTAIIDALKQLFPGVEAVNPAGGKLARAEACEWLLRAGNVFFPAHCAWVEALIDQFLSFPVGDHDDCVDAASQYLNWASGRSKSKDLFKKAMANVRAGKTLGAKFRFR